MGNKPSPQSLQYNSQHHLNGLSRMTLPEHTDLHGVTPKKPSPNPQLTSLHNHLQYSQTHSRTVQEQQIDQRRQRFYQSPYSILDTNYQKRMAPEVSNQGIRGSNQSLDSLRMTHLNLNTKKWSLTEQIDSNLNQPSQNLPDLPSRIFKRPSSKAIPESELANNQVPYDGNTNQKPALPKKSRFYQANNLLEIPSDIDEMITIRMTQKSQSHQLYNSRDQHENLNNTQNTINQIIEKDYDERGYFILTDTKIGDKKMCETADTPQSSSKQIAQKKSIGEWIAQMLCGIDEKVRLQETPDFQGNQWECNIFHGLKKPNMITREQSDQYDFSHKYEKRRFSFSNSNQN